MTSALRALLVGIVIGAAASLGVLTLWRPVQQPWFPLGGQHTTPSPTQSVPTTPDHELAPASKEAHPSSHGASSAPAVLPDNMMVVSPERLQSIGVKFDLAAQRPLERLIRTVGRVEVDETRLAHINIKIAGWIDELFVNHGSLDHVRPGEIRGEGPPEHTDCIRLQWLPMRDQHTLNRPGKHAPEKYSRHGSVAEEKEPRGAAWPKPGRHPIQTPGCSLKAMLELEHVKRKIGENQRRTRAMEERYL